MCTEPGVPVPPPSPKREREREIINIYITNGCRFWSGEGRGEERGGLGGGKGVG